MQARELALDDLDGEVSPLACYWFAHGADLADRAQEYVEGALEQLAEAPILRLALPPLVPIPLRKFVPGVEPGYCTSYATDPYLPETFTLGD